MSQFIGAEIEDERVLEILDRLQSLGGNTSEPMREIAGFMETEVSLGFRDSRSPYGEAWDPVQRGGQPLVDKGILRNSINSQYGADFAEVGTNVVYGPIHQFGGKTGRNYATEIEPRPYLPIQGDEVVLPQYWEDEILGILQRHLDGVLNG